MRNLAFLGMLVLFAAGCTSSDSGRTSAVAAHASGSAASSAAVGPAPGPSASSLSVPFATRRIAAAGFARLPDRGDLAAYPSRQTVVSEGAYTWHRVDLSEEHALAAIAGGHLRITTPSGEKLDFRYERHVEHPSGDWTWVGRIDRGGLAQEAIITFGERAVFGSIAQPGKPALKLTLRDGKSWLVETDPAKLALIDNAHGPDDADDYLIPSAAAKASSVAPASASIGAAETAADGQVVVDVLVGYSNGFANGLGGASQAVTRLNYLVEVTNQAYVNSQITARIRMVHAMQVNYADNSDNGSALEKLTGTRTTPVDPAFNALRTARDQYGADLVSFVRKYDRAAQDGCGIAWLLGGGQQPITTSSAPNGYSVVSDGRQNDGGTTYFCRDETFAHELGHNMGAQHDRATASSGGTLQYGAYAYSFGFKAGAATGNFYDIMAYGDPGQTSYRVFSNPRISTCGGFVCGVAGEADAAQTLNQTTPIIATFRATTVVDTAKSGWMVGVGGKCLDVRGKATAAGAPIQVWDCSGEAHQQWSFANEQGAIVGVGSGRVLDVVGYGTVNGSQLQLWDSAGTSNQSWYFNGSAIIASGGRVLDAAAGSSANGTLIQLWDSSNTPHQTWFFDPLSGEIKGKDGKCLDVQGAGTASGTPVQLWNCNSNPQQKWRLGARGQILGYGNNCLEVADGRSDNGAPVRMWQCNGLPHQSWALRGEIRSRLSNRCLDDPGYGQYNGSRVHMWDCHLGLNQRWTFYWK